MFVKSIQFNSLASTSLLLLSDRASGLVGNQKVIGSIAVGSTRKFSLIRAACVTDWKIIFFMYSSGLKFTITSLIIAHK